MSSSTETLVTSAGGWVWSAGMSRESSLARSLSGKLHIHVICSSDLDAAATNLCICFGTSPSGLSVVFGPIHVVGGQAGNVCLLHGRGKPGGVLLGIVIRRGVNSRLNNLFCFPARDFPS